VKRFQLNPEKLPQLTPAQTERLDRMRDEGIDYSDISPLGEEFFERARERTQKPPRKE